MGVKSALQTSIDNAIKRGSINETDHGAIIEAALKVAAVMDEPEWPIVRGKIDNVSPSVFLKYCDALGIVPNVEIGAKPSKPKSKLTAFSSSAKFAKAAND